MPGDAVGTGAPATVVLSATDPAQPYGGTLPWPESPGRPARIGAALVVLRHGVPLVWHDRRSHHLVTFAAAGDDHEWAAALAALVDDGRARSVEIRKINGARRQRVTGWRLGDRDRPGRRVRRRLPRPHRAAN